jgi:Protein of unknown function (DUF1566)
VQQLAFSDISNPSGNAEATTMPVMNVRFRLASSIGTVGLLLLVSGASVFARVPPEEKCADAKAKASALAVFAEAQCQAKAVAKGTAVDPACLSKAESKLRASFVKADTKGVCAGDADVALSGATACMTAFSGAIAGDARCAAKKLKAAGVKARNKATCARKAAANGKPIAPCLAKVETSFSKAILKAEQKAACTGTAAELEELVDGCVDTLPPPRTCSGAGYAACNGTCPDGLTCRPYEVFADGASIEAGCSCVDVSNGPACGGAVCGTDQVCPDPGFVCEQWTAGDPLACDHTICQPALVTPTTLPPDTENRSPCVGGEFPTCGGTCPNGGRCQSFEAFLDGFTLFGGCLCVDPTAPRCEATTGCDINVLPFSHCADPSQTCLVTLEGESGNKVTSCSEAHCGVPLPTTTSTSSTTTTSTSTTTTSSTSTSTSSTTTSTLPCTSTPSVSGCFEDLGNCTILDHCTGLQWEEKGTTPGPHHVNNRYVWAGCCEDGCQTICQPNEAAAATCMAQAEAGTDGCGTTCPVGTCYVQRAGAITTIWDWVNQLNAENFAGHSDWRLAAEAGYNPTGDRELESILLHPCSVLPCIDPIFGPTASARYWSRTGDVTRSIDAWYVDFYAGDYANLQKREGLFVRAVR